ncbi:Serine/threonine-protein kinase 32C [Golovinomyces cichoracearum]|uniref:Serine/threonine-protein kinase 32C n=1 Tax=Golovinomyces cichoracearum TaxID=62708 RepID=A0A420HD83_9PEZI|nr:Serine/threonine-protein kinase 32C [Golovinomyces cichoracearum]
MGNSQAKPCFSDEVNLSHFRLLQVVGRGAFGKVRIVERKDVMLPATTSSALVLMDVDRPHVCPKVYSQSRWYVNLIVRSESVRNILRERRMLEQLNYQFICNLRYSFQDIEHMYLVVDLMNGGDLRFHISRKTFTEEAVRFWISELGLALRYIHSQGIVHRDIKPDNVLLDAQGHVHLADFNVASDITPGKQLTSKSGTLAYLAPEVFSGNGYSCEADWWSLGVLFYESIYNKRPFEKTNNTSLRAQILEASPKFPLTEPPVSIACMHAISSALEEDPKKRMGCVRGDEFASFTGNPFFQAIDFDALERKEIEPIFVPSSEKTNFDATYDLEEVLLEEAPLEARARRQKPREQLRENASEKEIREEEMYKLIDDQFTPFDYTTVAYEKLFFPILPNI